MFNKEEEELMKLGRRIDEIKKPDSIDDYIKRGIEEGRKRKRRKRVKFIGNVAAVLILAVLVTSIRVSPAFAQYLSSVPGLEYIVKLINYDKGLKDAVNNDFVQRVNLSEEHDDLVFTIKDIIMDNSKAIIFYSIENKGNHRFVNLEGMRLKEEDGKEIIASMGWDSFINKDMSKEKKLEGKVEFNFNEETNIPNKLLISVKLRECDDENTPREKQRILEPTWSFEISVDKKKFEDMRRVYNLNHNVEVEGQKILFKTLTITPTRIALDIQYDKNNSKKLFSYDDIALYDEKGEKWGTIMNGVTGTRLDDNNETLYFQSNYFKNPREIYIMGNSIRALDKDKLRVKVDMDNEKLLEAPDDRLSINSIYSDAEGTHLEFNLTVDRAIEKNHSYEIFDHKMVDSNGKEFNKKSSYLSTDESNIERVGFVFQSDIKLKNPVYLTICDYPTRIKGEFKVRVK